MRLAASDVWFELRVAGYQFPGNATADYDSNWLIIEGTVRSSRGKWQFRDPCLLTYEVTRLADWLEAVGSGIEQEPWCSFIEPNLNFEVVGEIAASALRVSLAVEAIPPWAKFGEDVFVEFPMAGLDLVSAVASLRRQRREFPQRAER